VLRGQWQIAFHGRCYAGHVGLNMLQLPFQLATLRKNLFIVIRRPNLKIQILSYLALLISGAINALCGFEWERGLGGSRGRHRGRHAPCPFTTALVQGACPRPGPNQVMNTDPIVVSDCATPIPILVRDSQSSLPFPWDCHTIVRPLGVCLPPRQN
jgi:hypothetical protein